ncbi:serine/threonine-protein phosphatase 4 catalytic subunit [Enteropsectra breve]|nr:serine/threonine-protein phosphatase 4 catalytic subunit [Enteropsectra breve]
MSEQYASFISRLQREESLTKEEIFMVCEEVIDLLLCEPNIIYKISPAIIVGDIHGQFSDLQSLLQIKGPPGDGIYSYIFLGDFVDRGESSLSTILLLLAYKVCYPSNVVLLRGNHEHHMINSVYGFYDEVIAKYGDQEIWEKVNEVFSYFSIGCVIDNVYFAVHGGISPRTAISRLQRIQRFEALGKDSIFFDIMWSDPYYQDGAAPNPRGKGFLFGEDILKQFLIKNNVQILIRSHQLAIEGFKWDFNNLCLTIWSAPNYMGKCLNPASILVIEPNVPITTGSVLLFQKSKAKNT